VGGFGCSVGATAWPRAKSVAGPHSKSSAAANVIAVFEAMAFPFW